MPTARLFPRCMSSCAALIIAAVIIIAGAVAVSASAASPPTSAYMQPHPKPLPDTAAKAFVDGVVPELRSYTPEQLASGVVAPAAPTPTSKAATSKAATSNQASNAASSDEPRPVTPSKVESSELLARAGVGTGAAFDARWALLLAIGCAIGGVAARFLVARRSTVSTGG